MARERIPVRKIREVLRLAYECRLRQREAAALARSLDTLAVAPSIRRGTGRHRNLGRRAWQSPE